MDEFDQAYQSAAGNAKAPPAQNVDEFDQAYKSAMGDNQQPAQAKPNPTFMQSLTAGAAGVNDIRSNVLQNLGQKVISNMVPGSDTIAKALTGTSLTDRLKAQSASDAAQRQQYEQANPTAALAGKLVGIGATALPSFAAGGYGSTAIAGGATSNLLDDPNDSKLGNAFETATGAAGSVLGLHVANSVVDAFRGAGALFRSPTDIAQTATENTLKTVNGDYTKATPENFFQKVDNLSNKAEETTDIDYKNLDAEANKQGVKPKLQNLSGVINDLTNAPQTDEVKTALNLANQLHNSDTPMSFGAIRKMVTNVSDRMSTAYRQGDAVLLKTLKPIKNALLQDSADAVNPTTTIYHGTHNDDAADILKNGLDPARASSNDMNLSGSYANAAQSALTAAKGFKMAPKNTSVMGITLPQSQVSNYFDQTGQLLKPIPPQFISKATAQAPDSITSEGTQALKGLHDTASNYFRDVTLPIRSFGAKQMFADRYTEDFYLSNALQKGLQNKKGITALGNVDRDANNVSQYDPKAQQLMMAAHTNALQNASLKDGSINPKAYGDSLQKSLKENPTPLAPFANQMGALGNALDVAKQSKALRTMMSDHTAGQRIQLAMQLGMGTAGGVHGFEHGGIEGAMKDFTLGFFAPKARYLFTAGKMLRNPETRALLDKAGSLPDSTSHVIKSYFNKKILGHFLKQSATIPPKYAPFFGSSPQSTDTTSQ